MSDHEQQQPQSNGKLTGWKEIGQYLGKSARTVQRWERTLGLPVKRIRTANDGNIVLAFRDEIDAWVSRQTAETLRSDAEADAPIAAEDVATSEALPAEAPSPDVLDEPAASPPDRQRRPSWIASGVALVVVALAGAVWMLKTGTASEAIAQAPGVDAGIYAVLENGIVVIDELSGRPRGEIGLPANRMFEGLTSARLAREDGLLVIGTQNASGVTSVNLTTGQWGRWFGVPGRRIQAGAISPGAWIAALDQDGAVQVSSDNLTSRAIPIREQAFDVIPDVPRQLIYAVHRDAGAVSVIDVAASRVLRVLSVGSSAGHIAATQDRSLGFVTTPADDALVCVDLLTGRTTGSAAVGKRPWAVEIDPTERYVFVGNVDDNSVSVVDRASCTTVSTITAVMDRLPIGELSINGDGTRLYVAARGAQLAVFDLSTLPSHAKPMGRMTLPGNVVGLAGFAPRS